MEEEELKRKAVELDAICLRFAELLSEKPMDYGKINSVGHEVLDAVDDLAPHVGEDARIPIIRFRFSTARTIDAVHRLRQLERQGKYINIVLVISLVMAFLSVAFTIYRFFN